MGQYTDSLTSETHALYFQIEQASLSLCKKSLRRPAEPSYFMSPENEPPKPGFRVSGYVVNLKADPNRPGTYDTGP